MIEAERFVPEPRKDTGHGRSPFERDRARVLHSAAFRRLAAKTQVHTAGSDDFLRTRLTHSLEVAQIAREMGARLGCDPDVVDVAGLAHDLGHPPFGHNGEDALDAVAQECGGFEGNAQTLRVLTRLEAKIDGAGLNLTRASLDATCKYPWPRRPGAGDIRPEERSDEDGRSRTSPGRSASGASAREPSPGAGDIRAEERSDEDGRSRTSPGRRKFGVYADDAEIFTWARAGAPGEARCLEAQVMDWADDVAYSVHDVEDGVHGGYIALGRLLADADERAALCADVSAAYSAETPGDLAEVLTDLLADPALAPLARYDGSYRAQAALKGATSAQIGRFVAAAVEATKAEYEIPPEAVLLVAGPRREEQPGKHSEGPLRRYAADLIVPRLIRAQCALLKGMALRYVMRRDGAERWYERQREILTDLVRALATRAPDGLDPIFAPLWKAAPDDASRLRVVIDQVASLTDPAAVAWHQRLSGG